MYTIECPWCGAQQAYTGSAQPGVYTFCTSKLNYNCANSFEIMPNIVSVGIATSSQPPSATAANNGINSRAPTRSGYSPTSAPTNYVKGAFEQAADSLFNDKTPDYITKRPNTCDLKTCEIVHVNLAFSEYDYCRTHKIEVDKKALEPETDTRDKPSGWPSYW